MTSKDADPQLGKSVFFEQLDAADQQKILSVCSNETWQKGRSVLSQDLAKTIYFVISGHVKSQRINPETGRAVTLFLFGPGDMFDALRLLEAPVQETIFEAYGDVALLAVPIDEVRDWINRYPEFNRALLPYLGRMLAHLENKAADLALHDTETRLAHLIVHHLEQGGRNGLRLINNMSHENLAQMIGSVRTVVNRQLQQWRHSGLIANENGKITVKELEKLLDRLEKRAPGQ